MIYNFVTKEPTLTVAISKEFVTEQLSTVFALKQSFECHKFKGNHEMETGATRFIATKDTD
jgi:hypothetical protein